MSNMLDISLGIKVLAQPQMSAMSLIHVQQTTTEYMERTQFSHDGFCSFFEAFMTITHFDSDDRTLELWIIFFSYGVYKQR